MANLSGNSQILVLVAQHLRLQISHWVPDYKFLEPCKRYSATLNRSPGYINSLGGIEMLGDLTGSVATAPMVAAGAITLAKMANLSGNFSNHW